MIRRGLSTAIGRALERVDRPLRRPCLAPTRAEEGTRYPERSWDLRTVIAVFEPGAPLRYLNLNTLCGMTGSGFDQHRRWQGAPRDAFDLQLCLEGRDAAATYKEYHRISDELDSTPGEVRLRLGDRLQYAGQWPDYRVRYRQPEAELELDLELESWPGFRWWARLPRSYCHYTTFASCRLRWRWGGERGEQTVPALHDHGWGGNLLPLRVPIGVFRYEVLRLPSAADQERSGYAISLWTEAPLRVPLRNVGHLRPSASRGVPMETYECTVLDWGQALDYTGRVRRVPRRWRGHLRGSGGALTYEAQQSSPPRAVLGDGFLYAFDYQGEGRGLVQGTVEGQGYVEQLGSRFLGKTRTG